VLGGVEGRALVLTGPSMCRSLADNVEGFLRSGNLVDIDLGLGELRWNSTTKTGPSTAEANACATQSEQG